MNLDFNLRRLGLNRDSKILSITHWGCMDGTIASLVLESVFKNITSIALKYDNNRDEVIRDEIESDKYDFIFLTDISPIDPGVLKNKNKVILLDHHKSSIYHHNPKENKYCIPDKFCGSSLTKKFVEEYFKIELKHLNDLCYLSHDYDLWHKKCAKSTFLNELHFYYYPENFKKRFYGGDTRFTKEEIAYLRKRKEDFQKVWDDLEIFELDKIGGALITATSFVNELCEKLYTGKYNIVFARNPEKNSVSVRCKEGFLDIGEILKSMSLGGGHPSSGAFICKGSIVDVHERVRMIEDVMYAEIRSKKKVA